MNRDSSIRIILREQEESIPMKREREWRVLRKLSVQGGMCLKQAFFPGWSQTPLEKLQAWPSGMQCHVLSFQATVAPWPGGRLAHAGERAHGESESLEPTREPHGLDVMPNTCMGRRCCSGSADLEWGRWKPAGCIITPGPGRRTSASAVQRAGTQR